jgi:hypothetical protein
LLLAVVADIDAGSGLLFHHVLYGAVDLFGELPGIHGGSLLAKDQKLGKSLIARQTAHVRGKDAVPAGDHRKLEV